jgi:hypothetical protein
MESAPRGGDASGCWPFAALLEVEGLEVHGVGGFAIEDVHDGGRILLDGGEAGKKKGLRRAGVGALYQCDQ